MGVQLLGRTSPLPHWVIGCVGAVVLALAFGPGHIRPATLLQVLNDDPRHILAGGGLDPFQARR